MERRGPGADDSRVISFVIPAHNEQHLLGATLAALDVAARSCGEPFEILVVDDSSNDRTAAIAAANGARVLHVTHRQISATRNSGGRAARGEFLVFVDADTRVHAAVLAAALVALRGGAVGGGCNVRFDGRLAAWALVAEPVFTHLQRATRFAAGCFLFCTREAFEAIGGFDESVYAGEEVLMSRALHRRGRFVLLRETVWTSGRKLREHSGWELLRFVGLVARRGRGAVESRDGLDIWYGPRRDDPEPGEGRRAA